MLEIENLNRSKSFKHGEASLLPASYLSAVRCYRLQISRHYNAGTNEEDSHTFRLFSKQKHLY